MLHHLEKGFGPIHDEFLDKSKFNIKNILINCSRIGNRGPNLIKDRDRVFIYQCMHAYCVIIAL